MNFVEFPVPVVPRLQGDEITDLLHRWSLGERDALDTLLPVIYEELRRLARSLVRGERQENTLQATGLVHETFIRLSQRRTAHWGSRGEFFGWAAKVMRHVLVDHARSRRAAKRGGGAVHVDLDDAQASLLASSTRASDDAWSDLMALEEALERLEQLDVQQARVVELRFFADLGVEQTADLLGISPATVKRDWATARAWLLRELKRANGNSRRP